MEEAVKENYGILELFIKENQDIKNLNKYHLIKDANINVINNTISDNIITTSNFIIKDYTLLDKTNFYTQTLCLVKRENK